MEIIKRLFFMLLDTITTNENEAEKMNNSNSNSSSSITTTAIENELTPNNDAPKAQVNLMNKIFHFHSSQSEPPEFPYENEAWSPDEGYVRLFHKGRDRDSTSSHL